MRTPNEFEFIYNLAGIELMITATVDEADEYFTEITGVILCGTELSVDTETLHYEKMPVDDDIKQKAYEHWEDTQ